MMSFGSVSIKISPMICTEPWTRREWLAISILTVLGAGLRFWGYGRLGLNHFDEGIYALSGLWSMSPHALAALDPMVIAYAPPGFPILVGILDLVLGVADLSAILASTLCGVATIPIAGWVGRRTFGPGAGAAAAALAAMSMPHIAFSRKALTDVPFGLVWMVAIGLGGRFLEKPTVGRALALGLGVGLAQQFKYNGWLTGVIVALAALLGLVWHADLRRSWLSAAQLRFGPIHLSVLAALVAIVVYRPWFQFVESHGGYHALLAHHRSYLGGTALWLPYWKQQQAQLVALSGGPAWGLFTWTVTWFSWRWTLEGGALFSLSLRTTRLDRMAVGFGGALAFAALSSFPWWVGVATVLSLLVALSPGYRILGSWWLILSVLTPFYHPYARLWLPLHAAGWLLVAGLLVGVSQFQPFEWDERTRDPSEPRINRMHLRIPILICALVGFAIQWMAPARNFSFARFYQPTSTLREMVADLPNSLPDSAGRGPEVLILGRRPIAFYLLLQGRYPFRLVEGIDEIRRRPGEWAIVDDALFDGGIQSVLTPDVQKRVQATRTESLDPVTLLDVEPGSALVENPIRSRSILLLKPTGQSTD